jgi:hypothetical protein
MSKHLKQPKLPNDDLKKNPMIGASKGMRRAGVKANEICELEGENTIEGDVENNANRFGGIPKHDRGVRRIRGEPRAQK